MKKKVNIMYLLFILFIVLFSHITKNSNIITLVISSSLGILLYNTFSKISINSILDKYKNKYKIYKISIVVISIIFTIFAFLSFLLGNIISIEGLNIVNIVSVLFILTILLIKLTGVYLEKINYKKLGIKLLSIYELLIIIISSITSILLYKVFNLKDYINVVILYLVNIIIFLVIMLLLYIFIFRKNKNKVREKYNYKELIKNIFNINNNIVLYSIIKESYIYTSIIILYYILINKYNYSYESTSIIITNIYFYGIIFIRYINYLLKKYLDFNYNNLAKVTSYLLSICILLMVISGPICRLLFNTNNFLFDLILLLFFYTLYDYVIDTSIKVNNNEINKISLLSGLIIKLIFEIPLINANYRIGYNLSFGGILSIIIGMTISIAISIIFISKKLKINILDNFNDILDIIYQNIILCLILVLFTLIVKVDTQGIISSILVIIFYIFITILFYIIRKLINKK